MPCQSGLVRRAAAIWPALLTACPQLLSDEYYVQLPGDGPTAGASSGPDAGTESPDGGASGGAGGSRGAAPRAGSGGDAGAVTPPRTPTQEALAAALVHRYRFDADAPLLDSVGGANAVSVGASFSDGAAVLAGTGTGQYIDLPNGMLAGLRNASFEVWLIWDETNVSQTTAEWQRIFDLGSNPTNVEGQQCPLNTAATALFLTPRTDDGQLMFACESCNGSDLTRTGLPTGVRVQLVGVVNDDANLMSLYQDGRLAASIPFTGAISQVTSCSQRAAPCDWNNWLGRSQHIEDPPFVGRILDFRVYSAALRADLIQASFAAGPDADW